MRSRFEPHGSRYHGLVVAHHMLLDSRPFVLDTDRERRWIERGAQFSGASSLRHNGNLGYASYTSHRDRATDERTIVLATLLSIQCLLTSWQPCTVSPRRSRTSATLYCHFYSDSSPMRLAVTWPVVPCSLAWASYHSLPCSPSRPYQ